MVTMDLFCSKLLPLLDVVCDSQHDSINKAADICAESIANNGVIHVFGSGHSVGFGMEMVGQVGSLVPIHTIETSDFVLKGEVTLEQFRDPNVIFERTPNIANRLYDLYPINPNDAFIIISNSGINGLVIDLADTAKQKGHKVIVVTSWQHTNAEPSRHPSGKKLYEYGDVMIDNCGPRGDALIETGNIEKVCSVSSITGAYIAQSIETETITRLIAKGVNLPVLENPITKQAKKRNEALYAKYKGRI